MPEVFHELRRLAAELAGRALTGRKVTVFLEKPLEGARGQAFRLKESGIIYIDWNLEDSQLLETFCHELGHLASHFCQVEEYTGKPSGRLVDIPQERRMPEVYEEQARSQASRWYEKALELEPGGNFILCCLALTKEGINKLR